jgi:hypothetical protein
VLSCTSPCVVKGKRQEWTRQGMNPPLFTVPEVFNTM